MRLRLSKPPLFLMIVLAIIAGVVFFIMDNAPEEPSPQAAQPTAAQQVAQTDPTPTPAPAVQRQPTATLLPPTNVPTKVVPTDTQLFIPTAGILSNVVEAYLDGTSWDVSQLRSRVGHLQGTSWVNQRGNIVLSGHVEMRDGSPGVFANLDQVDEGEIIELRVDGDRRRYIVTEIRTTTPDDLSPVMPTRSERLTLITCGSYNFLQNAYLERLIVIAEPL